MEGQADALWATMHQCARTKMIRDAAEPGPRRAPEPYMYGDSAVAGAPGERGRSWTPEARRRGRGSRAHTRTIG